MTDLSQRKCSVCQNASGNRELEAAEMMFGTRDKFTYLECASCGCLELLNPPADLSRYYPRNYYSMAKGKVDLWLRYLLCPSITRYWLGRVSPIGYLLGRNRRRLPVLDWLERHGIRRGSSLLDVGSGAGGLLFFLRGLGFNRLVGVDPFIASDLRFPGGITILKRQLGEVEGSFDYVVFNHSFEHMEAPLEVLKHVRSLIAPGGRLIISTPIAATFAWREYGVDWVQLDAPRHLFIPSVEGLKILAGQAGLHVTDVVFNSTEFQFWGSEQYRAGIPLTDKRSYRRSPRDSIFTPAQIAVFTQRADELNKSADGDTASFYLEAS
ncbi:MAG: class I SAM-dependent methyltransferase [Chloroflexi bacterium]|nr:MAG: class I SAM-dependent methyltransferase [Chloroflexota bacterium]